MKKALISTIIISIALCTGCTAEKVDSTPTNEEIRTELFLSSLPTDEKGDPIYPDSYAGDFFGLFKWFFKVTDIEKVSEYQYLKDAYPNIEFQEAKYSYNYLQSLIDDYFNKASDEEMSYRKCSYVDSTENRAVIVLPKEILDEKEFDKDSPLIFKPKPEIVTPL